MGYDLHITRKESWAANDGPGISLEEWQKYVATDPDIESDPENPGPKNYVIVTHPERWSLWWNARRCEVYTKNPDDSVIAKMVQIARALDAKVLGDENEIYGIDPSDPARYQRR